MAEKLFILYTVFVLARLAYSDPVIEACSGGFIYAVEDKTTTFTCTEYGSNAYWYYSNGSFIGWCIAEECFLQTQNPYRLRARQIGLGYKSDLEITNVSRQHNVTFNCFDGYYNGEKDSCKLEVIAPARVNSENCSVRLSNWQVTATCSVLGMYASNNRYRCAWFRNNDKKYEGFGNIFWTYRENNGRQYRRGECSFTEQIPANEGNYTYSLKVFPGYGNIYYQDTLSISYPEGPVHNCPEHVFEGTGFNCTCTATSAGSPPAKPAWGRFQNETLHLNNVSRSLNGKEYICQLLWAPDSDISKNTIFILSVAHGPSSVLLNSTWNDTESESKIIRLTCTAIDVYPSAAFTWNIICHNITDNINTSTCIFQQDEHLVVTCTARNALFENVFLSQTVVLSFSRDEMEDTAASTGSVGGGVIGGVVAAAMIALFIATVVVVYIVKCRKGHSNRKNKLSGMQRKERGALGISSSGGSFFHVSIPLSKLYAAVKKPKTQTPIERHPAPSGELYTIPSSVTTQQDEDEYASVYEPADNNTFEAESIDNHQAEQILEKKAKLRATTQSTDNPAVAGTKVQDLSGGYMNVTEVPTDSGLGIYHVVPWTSVSGAVNPDSSTQAISEEEYNALCFEKDRAGLEDSATDYNHLQITEENYFTLELA